jgi:hypothetical protein
LSVGRFSLSDLAQETLYTKLVLEKSPECKALVKEAEGLHSDVQAARAEEERLTLARLSADVQVSLVNRRLDQLVARLRAVVNQRTDGQADHPLYLRFFSRYRPSLVIRMALATELPVVEPWLDSLKGDPDAELAAVGAELATVVAAGRAAVSAAAAARQALRDFDAGPRLALFSQVNTARASLSAALRGIQDDDTFLDSFFRQNPKRPSPDDELPSVSEARARIESKEQELQAARDALAAAEERERAEQARREARAEKEREREAKKRELAVLAARLAELEAELARRP